MSSDAPACWICLGEQGTLIAPCKCPRLVHQTCLARWQLAQCGKSEERSCRFCYAQLPAWTEAHATLPKAAPTMTVVHNGVAHQLTVGPGGRAEFEAHIRSIFQLDEGDELHLTWGCKDPYTNSELSLEGWEAWDAALHLASLSAGQRIKREEEEQRWRQQQDAAQVAGSGLDEPPMATSPPGSSKRWCCWGQ